MKSRTKNIIRSIRQNLNRFLSILFIVAIGAGFMAGLAATSPDMYETADEHIDSHKLFDINVKSPLGLDEEDIAAIKYLGITEQVVGAGTAELVLNRGEDDEYTVRVMSILSEDGKTSVNKTDLVSGRWPEKKGECVIESYMGKYSGNSPVVGDRLVISEENDDYEGLTDKFENSEFEIVGIVSGPYCLGIESDATLAGSGSIGLNMYTLREEYIAEDYTDIYIVLKGSDEYDTFSDEYSEFLEKSTDSVREVMDQRVEKKTGEIEEEIRDSLKELDDLESILKPLDETQSKLDAERNKADKEHVKAEEILKDSSLSELLHRVTADENVGDHVNRLEDIETARADADELLEKLLEVKGIIRTREDIACIASYDSNVGKVAALSKVFPVFFFLVALLVALTTMTRLVEENRVMIGTLKSLGYTNGQILSEYVLFSMLASVLGCIIGFAAGFKLFPYAISSAYSMLYFLPDISLPFRVDIALTVAPVTIVSILLATLFACWNEFRACPAQLMVVKAPAAGKRIMLERIPFLWKVIPFSGKVTCRNIFRYKKRFIMTIIGVAGCSALLLTGFGVRDSVSDIVDRQYGEVHRYELTMVVDDMDAVDNDEELKGFLSGDAVKGYIRAYSENGYARANGSSDKLSIFVAEQEKLSEYIRLQNRVTGDALASGDGVVITEKFCEELGVKVGDMIKLEDAEGHIGEAELTGIAESYIGSTAFISPKVYARLFGAEPTFDRLLCKVSEEAAGDSEKLTSDAMKSEHVLYATSTLSLKTSFADSIRSINAVVLVLILAAGLLCAVVLYNLTNVNICERRKELATIRVLGFYERETEKYIFRETNMLSLMGAGVGLILGIWLHSFVIKTVEVDKVMFGRHIYGLSYLYAIAITMVFTFIVNRIMSIQIRKVDMAQAMKAND